ncbi:thioesterase II family protein [Rhodopirellula baltica]|uniref:thioesterase II family protein n=1 Tax=Rhodopirellula baltica TaxID=265606 RepID=UPI00031A3CA7|nr:alpha/beta fold hydrolase [Rhodopirellula baltica]
MTSNDALCRISPPSTSKTHLLWVPHAGGATAPLFKQFRSLATSRNASHCVNLWAVRLAGRESRFSDPLETDMDSLVESIATETEPTFDDDDTLVLAGHSLGALIAYRLANRLLQGSSLPTRVKGLIVMGASPPSQWTQNRDWLDWDDADFADELDRRYGGLPAGLKQHPDALAMFLPIVRADLKLARGVASAEHPVIPVPIRALAGAEDHVANRAKMQGWKSLTSAGFSLRVLPGDHFFPVANLSKVMLTAETLAGGEG